MRQKNQPGKYRAQIDNRFHVITVRKDIAVDITRKINLLIFGCYPKRRKNHAFSFSLSKFSPVNTGPKGF
jgi:hypothetical protein